MSRKERRLEKQKSLPRHSLSPVPSPKGEGGNYQRLVRLEYSQGVVRILLEYD